MKGVTGRFLRKLKSISSITSLRQGVVFHDEKEPAEENCYNPKEPFPRRISLSERLKNEGQDEETDAPFYDCWKEIISKENAAEIPILIPSPADDCEADRLQVGTERVIQKAEESEEFPPLSDWKENFPPGGNERVTQKAEEEGEEFPTLLDFEENCPPEGNERVILYTTSLKGIRKTFEDCNSVKFLLESFKVVYFERDTSMHSEFREELWRIMGSRVLPPRLFIKGRHIGGAEEVVRLHEQGRLRRLFRGIPVNLSGCPCGGCGGVRFMVCSRCNGSRKVIPNEPTDEWTWIRCLECNDNGLIKCPICC